jgi:hypothetical protein
VRVERRIDLLLFEERSAAPSTKNYTDAFAAASGPSGRTPIVERNAMGDIVLVVFAVAGFIGMGSLAAGLVLRSRPLLTLGLSLLASLGLSWVLGLLGLPIGVVFGFLGTGAFFGARQDRSKD